MTLINTILIVVFLVLLGRYLYSLYHEGFYRPEEWVHQLKGGLISHDLYREFRRSKDKIRFFSWWLQIGQMKKENVKGAFAELGVYKGESARVLHLMDPSREFHLFDTFEGFKKKDLHRERGEAASYTPRHFADTSVEAVRKFLGESTQFVFHPGYFPETTKELDYQWFALVNIDADLYNPIKTGLEYFYARLSPGGAIFVHDYNYKWEGCRKAVDEFLLTIPENGIILPDQDGTLLILKGKKTV